jgi:sulfotransferase family protein
MARHLSRVPQDRTWVFILGCYDSGTTLLHDLVARSRDCARLPGEGVFLTSELVAPEDLGWTRLWWKVLDEMRDLERGRADAALVKKDWCFWYRARRPVFIEKSVSNAIRVPWIDRNFKGARFIYLVRNGYAVAEGIRRRAGQGPYPLPAGMGRYPIEWCARQWVASARIIEEHLQELDQGRVLSLTYEGLCANPSTWIARIGEFVGLGDLAAVDAGHVRDMNRESIAALAQDDLERINEVAAQELVGHGYELLGRAASGKA